MGIQDSLSLEPNEETTLVAKVLKQSEIQSYENKGQKREFFSIIIANLTSSARVRVYLKKRYDEVKEGKT